MKEVVSLVTFTVLYAKMLANIFCSNKPEIFYFSGPEIPDFILCSNIELKFTKPQRKAAVFSEQGWWTQVAGGEWTLCKGTWTLEPHSHNAKLRHNHLFFLLSSFLLFDSAFVQKNSFCFFQIGMNKEIIKNEKETCCWIECKSGLFDGSGEGAEGKHSYWEVWRKSLMYCWWWWSCWLLLFWCLAVPFVEKREYDDKGEEVSRKITIIWIAIDRHSKWLMN